MATKAQLEKELKKALTKLNFYEEACRKHPEPEKPIVNECKTTVNKMPEFSELLDRMGGELRMQKELCETAFQKVAYIDGLPIPEKDDKSKVYKMGVTGVIEQLNDVAQSNRDMMTTIASRLTELVG